MATATTATPVTVRNTLALANIGVSVAAFGIATAMGFLQECMRWWDYWLKGIDTGIMAEPMLRAWMQEAVEAVHARGERRKCWHVASLHQRCPG